MYDEINCRKEVLKKNVEKIAEKGGKIRCK